MSFSAGLVAGIEIGRKRFGGGGGGDVDTDPYYAVWQALPEPASNQVVFLLRATGITAENQNDYMYIDLQSHSGEWDVPLWEIDWGDGTVDIVYNISANYHKYDNVGEYTVVCTALTSECVGITHESNCSAPYIHNVTVMVKYGGGIDCCPNNTWYYYHNWYLKYFKYAGVNPNFRRNYFTNCYSLKYIQLAKPLANIYNRMFYHCYALQKVDLSQALKIEENAFYYCYSLLEINAPLCADIASNACSNCSSLRSLNAPLCTSVGSSAFVRNYALSKVIVADGCVFDGTPFQNCYSLYPRPDGSTN